MAIAEAAVGLVYASAAAVQPSCPTDAFGNYVYHVSGARISINGKHLRIQCLHRERIEVCESVEPGERLAWCRIALYGAEAYVRIQSRVHVLLQTLANHGANVGHESSVDRSEPATHTKSTPEAIAQTW